MEGNLMNVFIWGTGTIATEYLQCGELEKNEILGFIETQKSKDYFEEKKVYEPNEIIGMQYDYIIVCVHGYEREIYQTAMELGLDLKKLILLNNWEWADGENIYTSVPACCRVISSYDIHAQSIFPILYKKFIEENDIQARRYIAISQNGFDLVDDKLLTTKNSFAGISYQTDYFRYRTFELLANEIIQNKIEGSVAEVGVFRGAFSRLINAKFPKKTLYLFDTFDSFDKEEFEQELALGRVPEDFFNGFKKTSEEYVLSIMPYAQRCIVRKGLFPGTAEGLEKEKYAFVSIDVDFEISILEGLRYFYPRLEEGGAIFIHDYNNRFLEGVKIAVKKYEDEMGCRLKKIPLADEGGTLVVVK